MKVRSTKVIPQWILKKFFLVQDPCQLAPDQLDGYLRSKLLSSRGCDTIEYSKGERLRQTDLFSEDMAFYKSLPEWNEEHYDR